ncbi:MAG: ABC transporter permease [Clostridia bacterium]|nr:ABC transporter permease [Clostridia bacterium]
MKTLRRIYIALLLIFLYAPILVMIVFSFNKSASTSAFAGFDLKWYGELFAKDEVGEALKNTLLLAVLSSVIATVIGTAAAVGMSRMKRRWRQTLQNVTDIPMMNPDIVTAVSMLMLFVFVGTALGISTRSFVTVLIAHITFNLPYVVLSVLPKIRQMDKNLPEAARDLGCTPLQSFFLVELPAILPGVLSGWLMAFTLSLDDFIITQFTKGEGFYTLPTYIYAMTKKKVKPDMYALSTLIFLTILVLMLLSNFVQAKMEAKRDPLTAKGKAREAQMRRQKRAQRAAGREAQGGGEV